MNSDRDEDEQMITGRNRCSFDVLVYLAFEEIGFTFTT